MRVVELSGGVGGARLARGLAALEAIDLTIVVNVGDDTEVHGLYVSPDLDTVVYTLAGMEGPDGWGRGGDTFVTNDELARFGVDNTFRLGDRDLSLNIYRTTRLRAGDPLSVITASVTAAFGIDVAVLPATDDIVRTELLIDGGWMSFQDYFVRRGHQDTVDDIRFTGSDTAKPAPGVVTALEEADQVLIAPSNPPLSIWPILSISPIREVLEAHPHVTAISPLIGGKALKGPADRVMSSLGLSPGNTGVAEAYAGILKRLVIDVSDAEDRIDGVEVMVADTRIADASAARTLATLVLGL